MKIINIVLLIFLLLICGFSFYFYKNYISAEEKTFILVSKNKDVEINATSSLKQFVPNMRFAKNELFYSFIGDCPKEKKERMGKAFAILQNETKVLFFFESNNNQPDILIFCSEKSFEERDSENRRVFTLGEGGPSKFLNLTIYPLILEGEINLYSKEKLINCDYPVVELHELLHVFGYQHLNDEDSALYPYFDCKQRLGKEIIEDLKKIYSETPKTELLIVNVNASKKGPYLNFFIEITNEGLLESKNTELIVYDEKSQITKYFLGDIKPSYSRSLNVQNLFLKNLKTKTIIFEIKSSQKEYSYDNNKAILVLKETT